jgi:hypothetical protein
MTAAAGMAPTASMTAAAGMATTASMTAAASMATTAMLGSERSRRPHQHGEPQNQGARPKKDTPHDRSSFITEKRTPP